MTCTFFSSLVRGRLFIARLAMISICALGACRTVHAQTENPFDVAREVGLTPERLTLAGITVHDAVIVRSNILASGASQAAYELAQNEFIKARSEAREAGMQAAISPSDTELAAYDAAKNRQQTAEIQLKDTQEALVEQYLSDTTSLNLSLLEVIEKNYSRGIFSEFSVMNWDEAFALRLRRALLISQRLGGTDIPAGYVLVLDEASAETNVCEGRARLDTLLPQVEAALLEDDPSDP